MALLLALLVLSLKRSFATGRFKCTSAVSGYWKRYYNDALVAEANQHPCRKQNLTFTTVYSGDLSEFVDLRDVALDRI